MVQQVEKKDPSIEVTPEQTLIDDPVTVRIAGISPGATATLRVQMRWRGTEWISESTFEADSGGVIDVSMTAPIAGSYETVDPMGPIWSMQPIGTATDVVSERELTVTFTASGDGYTETTTITRTAWVPGVTRIPIARESLVGHYYEPPGEGRFPGVVLLEDPGGYDSRTVVAPLLASHGFAVLSLPYVSVGELPPVLDGVPLEYFETAVEWFRTQPNIRSEPIGVFGFGRGGELALLLGARCPTVRTVIAYAPSGVVFQGMSSAVRHTSAAWSAGNESLEHVPWEFSLRDVARAVRCWCTRHPFTLLPAYERGLTNVGSAIRSQASINVERTDGPVLLVTGTDDRLWPASKLAAFAFDRLAACEYEHPFEHLTYDHAGHALSVPYLPTTDRQTAPGFIPGVPLALGGTPRGYACADADAWEYTLSYLEYGLKH